MSRRYNRIMLGQHGMYADHCYAHGFIGAGFLHDVDLTDDLLDTYQDFKKKYIPVWLSVNPEKSKTSAAISCGNLWTICKGLQVDDVVITPNGRGEYYVGQIKGDYYYVSGGNLPHRRKVVWIDGVISRKQMSQKLQNSTGSIGTCCDVSKYADEIEELIGQCKHKESSSHNITYNVQKTFNERSLHQLFCSSLRNNSIYAQTIFHEKSSTIADQTQKWVHPDIVGVEIELFEDENTLALLKATAPREAVKLYSFELKKSIDSDYQLKHFFSQALSNSSWANLGYLVAFEISENLNDEMARLNNAFGIGIILMTARDYQILYPAKERTLDYNTIQKLSKVNPDFNKFIFRVANFITAPQQLIESAKLSLERSCDDVFKAISDIEDYCNKNNIPY